MSERAPVTEIRKPFEIDTAIEAAIEAKIDAAAASGVNILALVFNPRGDTHEEIFEQINFTAEEKAYMGQKAVHDMVAAAIGERIIQTLDTNGCRIARKDLIPSIEAYFEQNPMAATDPSSAVPQDDQHKGVDPSIGITIEEDGGQVQAEALHDVLGDLNLFPSIVFGRTNRLVFEIDEGTKPGAVDVAKLVLARFEADDAFEEAFIGAIGNSGSFYMDAPSTELGLRTATAETVIKAVRKAGFSPLVADYGSDLGVRLVFDHDEHEDRDLSDTDLIRILKQRYRDEPDFKKAVLHHLGSEGPFLAFAA